MCVVVIVTPQNAFPMNLNSLSHLRYVLLNDIQGFAKAIFSRKDPARKSSEDGWAHLHVCTSFDPANDLLLLVEIS